jgi:hypothetical protein
MPNSQRRTKYCVGKDYIERLRIGKTSPLFANRADKGRYVKSGAGEREAPRRGEFKLFRGKVLPRVLAVVRMIRGEDAGVRRGRAT